MATENRRVAAYLPKEIGDRLESFKVESGIKSDSPALIAILSEYFGVSQEVAHSSNSSLIQRLEKLENQSGELKSELFGELGNLAQRLDAIEVQMRTTSFREKELHDILDDIPSELLTENSITDNSIEDQPNEGNPIAKEDLNQDNLDQDSVLLKEPPSELLSEESTGNFQNEPKIIDKTLISQLESEPPIEVEQSKSPEDSSVDTLNSLKGELLEAKEKTLFILPNTGKTLTTKELAERLGVASSTVSHWRPTGDRAKSPDELLKVTREKDPDGIGWVYLPEAKRFQPERNIPAEVLEVSDGERPDVNSDSI